MKFRKAKEYPPLPTTRTHPKYDMAVAICSVFTKDDKVYYDDLSEDELYGYVAVLWDYHTDLRDEWSRREMMKMSPT